MKVISISISVNTPIGIATQIDMDIDMNFISIRKIDMNFFSMSSALHRSRSSYQISTYKCSGALLVHNKDISKPLKACGRPTTIVICVI